MSTQGIVKSEKPSYAVSSESAPRSLRFQPLDPDNLTEVAELRRQRMLCGWGLDSVDKWLDMIRAGDRVSTRSTLPWRTKLSFRTTLG